MGDSAVEVRQSTWTASLPGERYSSAWITSFLRTVVAADGVCALAAGSIALVVVRFNNWASVPLEYLIFIVILPVLWWTSVALAHGYEARFIGAGRRSFMGRPPARRSSLRVPVLPGRRDEVQMLRGSDSPRAMVSRHGGSARLVGLDFDRLTEETGAPPVGFDADLPFALTVLAVSAADGLRHPERIPRMNHPRDRNRTSLLINKVKAAQGPSQVGKSPFTDVRLLSHQTAGSITQ